MLASIHLDRGHLDRVGKVVESAVSAWDERGRPLTAGAADMYLVLGALAEEAGDVERARDLYAYTLAMTGNMRQGLLRALVLAQAGGFEARCGNHEVADSLVGEIPTWWPDFPPGLHLRQSYHRVQAELLLAAGRPEEARTHVADLIAEPGTSVAVCVGTLRTRVRLALGEADESDLEVPPGLDDVALPVRLARLLVVADVHLALGDHDAAIDIGRDAVALGLAAGFRATLGRSSAVRSLGRLLAPRGEEAVVDQILAMTAGGDPDESTAATVFLSDKENEVLAFLPTHLSYAGIAAELFVSVNTVKFHLKNVYGKLGVNDRAGAVHRARELGLIADR